MFACEQERVAPDFLCLGKGLTGGYMPLAATLTTERVYDGFLGAAEEARTFFHGHTFTGNPLACAAALASLEAFDAEDTILRLQPKIRLLAELLEQVAALDEVTEVRGRGFMVGIDLGEHDAQLRMGNRVAARGARARRDHPPARRHRRADATAGDLQGRASSAGRDHGGVDRGRPRIGLRPQRREPAVDRGLTVRPIRAPRARSRPNVGVMKSPLGRSTGMEQTLAAPATEIPDELDAAFERLYRECRDDLYAYVKGLVRERAAAEDVTALAFERAWRKRRSFKPRRGTRRAWLFGIARNAALDELRRGRRHDRAHRRAPDPGLADPADAADASLRQAALRAAMASLSARERELVALKFFAGLGNAEIAAVIGTTESNAGTRLHRVIEKLRSACDDTA